MEYNNNKSKLEQHMQANGLSPSYLNIYAKHEIDQHQ